MTLWDQLIKPMLAHLSEPFDSSDWCFEVKYDGTRCIAYIDVKSKSVKFLNRRLIFFQNRYPELLNIFEEVKARRVILDGEIVIFDKETGKPNFYKLAEREHVDNKTRIEILSKLIPATYVVFDILHKDGEDLIDLPLTKRKKILEKTVKESERILLSTYVIGKGKKFFKAVKRQGLEGIMAKKLNSPYLIGERSKLWLKIKVLKTLDCIIVGYSTGTGKREPIGSLILGCYHNGKLRYVGKVGTGFSEEELNQILGKLEKLKTNKCPFEQEPELDLPPERKAVWVKPKLICEVKFMNLSQNLIMRAPSFVRLRTDKQLKECILEV
jgi:bifunctional non-homologous end joining protein LigD